MKVTTTLSGTAMSRTDTSGNRSNPKRKSNRIAPPQQRASSCVQ
jgi:hypothetical protein